MNNHELIDSTENEQVEENEPEQAILQALELINSGKWRQLEGSIGRWCNDFLESREIIVDEERTKKEGPISFVDGYGRACNQAYFKIDWDRVDEVFCQEGV
tara:strand:- start:271 stop:573 length:303 start_codon:yes stop_codon:yes gene_type:complete